MQYIRQYIVVIVLVAFAVIASIILVPGSRELALMQMKDKHFDEARKEYEKQAAQGTLTLEVANNLTNLYLQVGAVDKAIGVMERFVKTHSDNMDARNKLGTLYQYAQRQDDYQRNLEEINKMKPGADNLRILSDIYNYKGEYAKQAQALRDLIATEKGKNPEHGFRSGNITIASGLCWRHQCAARFAESLSGPV